MAWCERKRIGYIFGLSGNPVLLRRVSDLAGDAALGRVSGEGDEVRRYGEPRYSGEKLDSRAPRHCPRRGRTPEPAPAKAGGADSRFIVTNLAGLPKALYEKVYCARGQAENPGFRRGRL